MWFFLILCLDGVLNGSEMSITTYCRICCSGLPSDILPTVRPELLGVSAVSDADADSKDVEAEDGDVDVEDTAQLPPMDGADDDVLLASRPVDDGVLVTDEERRSGVVRLSVYWSYWTAVGRSLAAIVLLSILLMQGSMAFCISVQC